MALTNKDYGLPIVMSVAGDNFAFNCRISTIIWEGTTTAGDVCEILAFDNNRRVWKGKTNDTCTYLGVGFDEHGVACPAGFKLAQITAGTTVSVYLKEV
jgi:hypothetical protein